MSRSPWQGDSAPTPDAGAVRREFCHVSQTLLLDLERAFGARRNHDGQRGSELWVEEQARLSPLPATPFVLSRMTPVEVSSQALVKVEGASYSTPSRWARLQVTA
jgi:hypothetical protein